MKPERRGYVVLVLISVFLSLTVLLYTAKQQRDSNHQFCDVFNALVQTPVHKPADPKADPSRERSYEIYLKFVKLDRNLGCE
jgi:hypothetical protein